jgi:predicted  nucleic acid-binding Zn-ribbon protein
MNNLVTKLSSVAALLGVVGAIGAGFVQYGKLVSKIEELDSREAVINQTVDLTDIEVKLKELETTIISLDNDVLDNLRNDIAGNNNDIKAITQDIIKDIKVIQSVLSDVTTNDDIDKLDKKLRTAIKELEEYAWELEEDIEENSKGIAIIKKENELQDILIEEIKAQSSNPLNG